MRRRENFKIVLAQGSGLFGGVLRSARGEGWDREKSLSAEPTPTRWCLRVPLDLPGGRRGLPFLSPPRVPGKPLAAASSSSHPFLDVLIGTGASGYRSLVEVPRWAWRSRNFFVFVDPPLSTFVSFVFLFVSSGRACVASAPSPIVGCIGDGCFVIQSGGNLISS